MSFRISSVIDALEKEKKNKYHSHFLSLSFFLLTLENNEEAIKKGQSRETGNIGYTRGRQTKQKHNTICVGHHYMQTNTNNVNKS
jgi:hypothetical protein